MNKFKAVIFDMDGLLIDSMIHWIDADKIFLSEHNIELTEDMIKYFSGRHELENIKWLKEKFNLEGSLEELLSTKNSAIKKIYSEKSQLMPGVSNLFEKIKKANIKQAIASGARNDEVLTAAGRFGWGEYFDHYVSSDHVNCIGKPDPGIYLYTAEKLGVDPQDCIVFEDAENGVVSAKAAGMKCIAVPDSRWSFGDFSGADLIASSLEDEKIFKYLGI